MRDRQSVKISSRNQIAVPKSVREQLRLRSGDRLLVQVRGRIIVLLPEPERYAEHLAGLHREIWDGVDAAEYVRGEREAWSDSSAA